MTELFVDYSGIGHARRFTTRVPAAVRRQLTVGGSVTVFGDDVPPARARVTAVSDAEVQLELEP